MTEHNLSDEQKAVAASQVDYFIDLVGRRYGVQPEEIMDAVKWVRERKQFSERIKSTGVLSLVGLLVSALGFALLEGVRSFFSGRAP